MVYDNNWTLVPDKPSAPVARPLPAAIINLELAFADLRRRELAWVDLQTKWQRQQEALRALQAAVDQAGFRKRFKAKMKEIGAA